jgi:hypothetical protein
MVFVLGARWPVISLDNDNIDSTGNFGLLASTAVAAVAAVAAAAAVCTRYGVGRQLSGITGRFEETHDCSKSDHAGWHARPNHKWSPNDIIT